MNYLPRQYVHKWSVGIDQRDDPGSLSTRTGRDTRFSMIIGCRLKTKALIRTLSDWWKNRTPRCNRGYRRIGGTIILPGRYEIYFPRVIYVAFRAPIFESRTISGTIVSRTLKTRRVFSIDRYGGESRTNRSYVEVCEDGGVHDADNSIVALADVQLVRDPEVT